MKTKTGERGEDMGDVSFRIHLVVVIAAHGEGLASIVILNCTDPPLLSELSVGDFHG